MTINVALKIYECLHAKSTNISSIALISVKRFLGSHVKSTWPYDPLFLSGEGSISESSLLIGIKDKNNYYLFIYFQRQDDYEYDESADYGEQDETEAALGLPADSSSIRENIGQVHHMFSQFLNSRIYEFFHDLIFL